MLAYDDVDHDTHLNLNEFYAAFSKLYSKPLSLFSLCCLHFSLSTYFTRQSHLYCENMHKYRCVCVCWIAGAELKTNLRTSVFFYVCCSWLSIYPRRNNILRLSNHFENETSRRLGLFTLSCLFFLSVPFFTIWLCLGERQNGGHLSRRFASATRQAYAYIYYTQCLDCLIYTRCALCGNTGAAFSLFSRSLQQNNRRQGALSRNSDR